MSSSTLRHSLPEVLDVIGDRRDRADDAEADSRVPSVEPSWPTDASDSRPARLDLVELRLGVIELGIQLALQGRRRRSWTWSRILSVLSLSGMA